jgi:hypothetical protein
MRNFQKPGILVFLALGENGRISIWCLRQLFSAAGLRPARSCATSNPSLAQGRLLLRLLGGWNMGFEMKRIVYRLLTGQTTPALIDEAPPASHRTIPRVHYFSPCSVLITSGSRVSFSNGVATHRSTQCAEALDGWWAYFSNPQLRSIAHLDGSATAS